ncbi:MAG: tRNA (guanosine(46)-N7)-methyltransferase TrmB [Prochloraceae cyanobacterium]|nr:tRNA (guanosine(46)-N7)-methyltransferase TrmB [Prochloraceae cyanobacterium]
MAKVRVRQHVNPLSRRYQTPITPPDWNLVYANLAQPLHLDIGCARGRFLLQMAQIQPKVNFLGIEIRESLVKEANLQRDNLNLTNLHYLFGNINQSINVLLESLPVGTLQYVTIQFPDPWFKKRHIKRRVVQPNLVDTLANYLVDGGSVFVQSDVESVAVEMRDRFHSHPSFRIKHQQEWLENNPFPVSTEREQYVLSKGGKAYRALFTKKKL